MPEADDLFRPTAADTEKAAKAEKAQAQQAPEAAEPARSEDVPSSGASGRVKHDEKITVYVTSSELTAVEQARLELRSQHGIAADRGRLVRTAIALALADLEENGEDSLLVRRLTES